MESVEGRGTPVWLQQRVGQKKKDEEKKIKWYYERDNSDNVHFQNSNYEAFKNTLYPHTKVLKDNYTVEILLRLYQIVLYYCNHPHNKSKTLFSFL